MIEAICKWARKRWRDQAGAAVFWVGTVIMVGVPLSALGERGDSELKGAQATTARVVSMPSRESFPGETVTLPIRLESQGDENSVALSVSFDAARFSSPQLTAGADAETKNAVLSVNRDREADGLVGVSLTLPPGQTFNAGTREILELTLTTLSDAETGVSAVSFRDTPIPREVLNALAQNLDAAYQDGRLEVVKTTPQKWQFGTDGAVVSSPAIDANGRVFVGSRDGKLYAVNPDGTERWSVDLGSPIDSSPTIADDGVIYIGAESGDLVALGADGQVQWRFSTGGAISATPAIGIDGTLYVGSEDGDLYAVDPAGTKQWSFSTGGAIESSVAIGLKEVLYVGSNDGKLYAVNTDGSRKWDATIDSPVNSSPAVGPNGAIYVGAQNGKIYAIDPDGTTKWSHQAQEEVDSSPAISAGGTIYVGSQDQQLYALGADGTLQWAFEADGIIDRSSPTVGSGGAIYVGSGDGRLYAVTPDGKLKWLFDTGGAVQSSPVIAGDGTVYFGSTDNQLFAVESNASGLADAAWPMFHRDRGHKGLSSLAFTPGDLTGTVYEDGDANGVQEQGEAGVSGVTVFLDKNDNGSLDSGESSVETASDDPDTSADEEGDYRFSDIEPGDYIVREAVPTDFEQTSPDPSVDPAHRVTLDPGAEVTGLDFGIKEILKERRITAGDGEVFSGETVTITVEMTAQGDEAGLGFSLGYDPATFSNPKVELGAGADGANLSTKLDQADEGRIGVSISFFGETFSKGTVEVSKISLTATKSAQAGDYTLTFLDEPVTREVSSETASALPAVYNDGTLSVIHGHSSRWQFTTGGAIESGPALSPNGKVIIGSNDGTLYAVNPDGTEEWAFATDQPIMGAPTLTASGTTYIGSNDGKLYSVGSDGAKQWHFSAGDAIVSTPAIGPEGTIYFGAEDQKLYALNSDGTKKWAFATEGKLTSSPAVGVNGVIVGGSADSNVYAIQPNGALKWKLSIGGAVESSPAIGANGTIYVGSNDNKLYAIQPDGVQKWAFETGGPVTTSPAIGPNGHIYFGSDDQKLYAVGAEGTKQWELQTGAAVRSSPAVGAEGTIYVGSDDGALYAVHPNGNQKWHVSTGGGIEGPPVIASDGTVYVGSGDGQLYAVSSNSTGLANTAWPMFHRNERHTGKSLLATPPADVSGLVFDDKDADGQQDADEPGLAGVTVFIDKNDDGSLDVSETSVTTSEDDPGTDADETGAYRLRDLEPGDYIFRVVPPADFEQTYPDPDVDHAHRRVLASDQSVTDLNFGVREPPESKRRIFAKEVTATEGDEVTVPILLNAKGDENGVAFTLLFDPALFSFEALTLAPDAQEDGAILIRNTDSSSEGKVGASLILQSGQVMSEGLRELLRLKLSVGSGTAGETGVVSFGSDPVEAEVSSSDAKALPVVFEDGNITVVGNQAPSVTTIDDQSINEDGKSGPLSFTVSDDRTPAEELSVTATADDTGLVPQTNMALTGSGAERQIEIQPAANENGATTIQIAVSDAQRLSGSESFTLDVAPVNDAPVATKDAFETDEDQSVTIDVLANDTDVDGDELTLAEVTQPANGELTENADGTLTYRPASDFNGSETFGYKVSDGELVSEIAGVEITVQPVDDPPKVSSIADQVVLAGRSRTISFSVSDIDTEIGELEIEAVSSNNDVLSGQNLTINGAGGSRELEIASEGSSLGQVGIEIRATDAQNTTTTAFHLTLVERRLFIGEAGGCCGTVSIPIRFRAQESESRIGFSLHFDSASISNPRIELTAESSNANLTTDLSQADEGRIGVSVESSDEQVFLEGLHDLVRLRLDVSPGTVPETVALTFEDAPVARETVSFGGNPLPTVYDGSKIQADFNYEGDLAPIDAIDQKLTITDFVRVGRFVVGLEQPQSDCQFQRIDVAPRMVNGKAAFGNGQLTISDFVQAGRYAVGLDPLTLCGGPMPIGARQPQSFNDGRGLTRMRLEDTGQAVKGATAQARIGSVRAFAGEQIEVPVTLERAGDGVTGISFSLEFDSEALHYLGSTVGENAKGAMLISNEEESDNGVIGVALAHSGGDTLPPNGDVLLNLRFGVDNSVIAGKTVSLTVSDYPTERRASNRAANDLTGQFVNGSVTIRADGPDIRITRDPNAAIQVQVPGNAQAGVIIETSTDLEDWSVLAREKVPPSGVVEVDSKLSGSQSSRFYRIRLEDEREGASQPSARSR